MRAPCAGGTSFERGKTLRKVENQDDAALTWKQKKQGTFGAQCRGTQKHGLDPDFQIPGDQKMKKTRVWMIKANYVSPLRKKTSGFGLGFTALGACCIEGERDDRLWEANWRTPRKKSIESRLKKGQNPPKSAGHFYGKEASEGGVGSDKIIGGA